MTYVIDKRLPRTIQKALERRRRNILIDLCTQREFFTADGKCCIRNHRRVLANIRRVMAWVRKDNIRVISMVQPFIENSGRNKHYLHRITSAAGAKKISYSLLHLHMHYQSDGYRDFAWNVFDEYDQVIQEIRSNNPFDEPRADRILTECKSIRFIVIGGMMETTVRYTVLGLLMRRKEVIVLNDAVGSVYKHASDIAMREMHTKGARLVDSKALLGSGHLRLVRACSCDRCRGRAWRSLDDDDD